MFRILLPVSEGLWLYMRDGCSSCWTHLLPTQFAILARSFRYWNIRVFLCHVYSNGKIAKFTHCAHFH